LIIRYFEYRVPFIHPIRIGLAIQSERRGIYLQATDSDGVTGWGEVSPLDGYGPDTYKEVADLIRGAESRFSPSLRFGLDCARREIQAKRQGISFRDTIGPPVRDIVDSAMLVGPETRPSPVSGNASGAKDAKSGNHKAVHPRFLKSKVGGVSVEDDLQRVLGLLESLPENGRLRLDANGIWAKKQAFEFADRLHSYGSEQVKKIEFIEEPWQGCFDSDSLGGFPLPVGIDENFTLNTESWLLADVILIKPALFGSIGEFLDAKMMVKQAGKRLVVSSAFETGLGMSALVALASTFEGGAEGFGTYRYLATDPYSASDSSYAWLNQSRIAVSNVLVLPGSSVNAANLKEVGI
jgi:o-succinylbenzoate synthase